MEFDAVILAGGRARRLGGVSKAHLVQGGRTLLQLALAAAGDANRVVVVGDGGVDPSPSYVRVREFPEFSGPVAAVAAGLGQLAPGHRELTLVLACDIPGAAAAVAALRERADSLHLCLADGIIAVDSEDRNQYLLALYVTTSLARRLSSLSPQNSAMKDLVHGLELHRVRVPVGSADDVDTWHDAERLGVTKGQNP